MFHNIYKPHPALLEYVNNIMVFRFELDPYLPRPEFSFPPLPEQCLYFYPFESPDSEYLTLNKKVKLAKNIVVGPQVNRIKLKMHHSNFTVKVGFQPGGLYRLMGVSMNEFPLDESLDSAYVLDKEISSINEQMAEVQNPDKLKEIIEVFLIKKLKVLKNRLPIDQVLPLVLKENGLVHVDHIAELACVSSRQLERLFLQRVGVSPKFFVRQCRFAKAWVMKENLPNLKWTQIAHSCGYFDQMHLIRDFKVFCGVLPKVIENEFNAAPFLLKNQVFY
ncbi:helix-turn-helix domain-containing protein [Lacihabitans lacunae]|uniref:Helix-turn-helix domain-containing protein n=1 Tax=Lacihabitans lacunae TaxID=1028214 RepID=A0ABV7YZA5_9BACT